MMRAQPKQIRKEEAGRLTVTATSLALTHAGYFFSLRNTNGLSKWLAAASFFAYEGKGGEGSAPRCVH